MARSDGISATILERDSPGDGSRQGGQFAEHDLDDVAKGIADIARLHRLALPSEPAVEEQLQEIEGQHPDQEQCVQGGWGVPIDVERSERLTSNYKQLRRVRRTLVRLHQDAVAALDQLERLLLVPPPAALRPPRPARLAGEKKK